MTLVNDTETRMKNTSDLTNSDGYHSLSPFNITLWIIYLLVIFVGVAGNVMVVCIVYRFRSMHSTTNYLISNLAIADSVSLLSNSYSGRVFKQLLHWICWTIRLQSIHRELPLTSIDKCIVYYFNLPCYRSVLCHGKTIPHSFYRQS